MVLLGSLLEGALAEDRVVFDLEDLAIHDLLNPGLHRIDLVEVAPAYDPSESTQILAAQILLNFLGFISYFKSKRA